MTMSTAFFRPLRIWILFTIGICGLSSLQAQQTDRIAALSTLLDSMSQVIPGLNDSTTLSMRDVPISEYVRAIGAEHSINLFIPDFPELTLTTILDNESVKTVFLFLCKQFSLSIEVTGTILEFKRYQYVEAPPEEPEQEPLAITYDNGLLSFDLQRDSLFRVIRELSILTGKKLLARPDLEGFLTGYLPPTPVDTALEALFLSNGFRLVSKRKGYILVESLGDEAMMANAPPNGNLDFSIDLFSDGLDEYVTLAAENADLGSLIKEIFFQADADYLIYDRIQGIITIEAEMTRLDDAMRYLLQATPYTYKREGELFLIGSVDLEGLQDVQIIKLNYRPTYQAIDLIPGATQTGSQRQQTTQQRPNQQQRNFPQNPQQGFNNTLNNGLNDPYGQSGQFGGSSFGTGTSTSIQQSLPPEIVRSQVRNVEIIEYPELNRIILRGPTNEVTEIARFLTQIDQPVPMVRIEMIVVEVNTDKLLSTGINVGRRSASDTSSVLKEILPGINYSLDGSEINRLLGSIPELAPLGVLRSDVYLQLRAQEQRGNLKVKMEPTLSMLNGRSATLTIGQTQYYLLETQTASTGAVNNFQTFTQRFERIDANVSLTVRPFISEDGMVTMDVMPDFTSPVGTFSADIPPTIATRRFASTIRVRDGETVILGGLSEELDSESTSGLPWFSRIPVLKYIFGNVNNTKNRSSLLIYLTPVVSYY